MTVALDLGYSSISAFISVFRKAFGITLARYRADGVIAMADEQESPA
jgi:AraC-like DNA-binding protein